MKENTDAKLNAKQKKFVNSVASGDFATDAYIEVYGCQKGSAASAASRLMGQPNIIEELERLKVAAEKETFMDIDQKRAMLAEIIMTPPWNLDPKSPLAQSVKIKRKTLPDGTVEEDITVRMPCKLRAMELDIKLSGDLNRSGQRNDGDTWQIIKGRLDEARKNGPSSFARSDIHRLKRMQEEWTECEHDPFDGKKKRFMRMLGKLIEFGYECRFMEYSNTYDLDQEIIAATEKRKKREEKKNKCGVCNN